jgi:hypothetical protein
MDPERLFSLIKNAIDTMPALHGAPTPERMQWLARASALVEASPNSAEGKRFRDAMDALARNNYLAADNPAAVLVRSILMRTFALAELNAPAGSQGTYIPAGNAFDAMAAISKVFSDASHSLLVVDPYADEKLLTDFLPTAPEAVHLQILSDKATCKSSFAPAVARWTLQYTTTRRLEAKLAAPRILHDRLIVVDDATVWIVTQSFNALAQRAPASVAKFDPEPGALKLDAYRDIWKQATPV